MAQEGVEEVQKVKKRLEEVYTNTADSDKPGNEDKIVLSNDAYAVCEYLEKIYTKSFERSP